MSTIPETAHSLKKIVLKYKLRSGELEKQSSTNLHCYLPVQLSSDKMYLTAIRNLARPSTSSTAHGDPNISIDSAGEEPGQLAKSYNSEKAKSMLYSIKDKEMAIAAAKWIAQQLPLGKFTVLFQL